jgi:DNA-binding NtrC family response regulator
MPRCVNSKFSNLPLPLYGFCPKPWTKRVQKIRHWKEEDIVTRLLVVDVEDVFPRLVRELVGSEHAVDHVRSVEEALHRLEAVPYDAILSDLRLADEMDGIELLRRARAREVDAPFIVLTGHATVETAVNAMREGAFDYLNKSATPSELGATLARAFDHGRMARELRRLRGEVAAMRGVPDRPVGQSPRIRSALALAERVAASDACVLILGESGTGKELTARLIHRASARRDGPFVAFDCSALAPSLLESELFGHEKGAFTGAQRARRGLFREAQAGTVFLDEIGDIAPEVQNKLLRVIQERVVKPVGGDQFLPIDARLLCATNKDLLQLVKQGRFREDLYYRLAVVPLMLPALRERKEDIPALVEYFLGKRRSAGPRPRRIDADALTKLTAYDWPGNIRELENVLERAAILSDGLEIHVRDLPALEGEAPPLGATTGGVDPRPLKEQVAEAVRIVERRAIVDALAGEGGSPSRAAKRLGISRASFYAKLKELDIPI